VPSNSNNRVFISVDSTDSLRRRILVAAVCFSAFIRFAAAIDCPRFPAANACQDVVNFVDHQALTVDEKVRKGGIKCKGVALAALPHCCLPGWEADPMCYVLNKKTLKDAWQETIHTTQCPQHVMKAVQEVTLTVTNPTTAVLPVDWFELYKQYVDVTAVTASPLPSDVTQRLKRIVGKAGILWSQQDLDGARYVRASDARGKPLFPGTYGKKDIAGITHGKLIVIADSAVDDQTCNKYAIFAHELTHVWQNRRDGENCFASKYLADATHYPYRDIPYEAQAFALQDFVNANYCPLIMQPLAGAPAAPGRAPTAASPPSKPRSAPPVR